MSIVVIRATFECDGCGTQFRVDMDPAKMRPKGWSLMDEAVDYVRGGAGSDGGMPMVVHDMHLCHACADIAAQVGPEEGGYAPKPQIERALAKHYDAMRQRMKPKRGYLTECDMHEDESL